MELRPATNILTNDCNSSDSSDTEIKLWPPSVADADIIFLTCGFHLFPRLISAVAEWMSTILLQTVWP